MNKRNRSSICAVIGRRKHKNPIGFTLIEILVSLTILGIFAGIAIPLYTGYIDQARNETAKSDIRRCSLALAGYFADNGSYPDSLAPVGCQTSRDPWGNPYQYLNIKTAKNKGDMRKDRFLVPINSDFDLYSMGKDRKSQSPLTAKVSRDDIIRANDGAYIGLALAF
jgi:general secretion pathway protein G